MKIIYVVMLKFLVCRKKRNFQISIRWETIKILNFDLRIKYENFIISTAKDGWFA